MTKNGRIAGAKSQNPEENHIERTIRPRVFDDLIGREKEKKNLKILIEAAKKRGEPLDHILFFGPPGLGKTTLAHIMANEMGSKIRVTSGPAIERQGDLAAILTNLNDGDVLFIDEIHRLHKIIEEVLYPAMEEYAIDLVVGKGTGAKTLRLDLPKFTLIGATTRIGLLSSPLRDRFGVLQRLDFFSAEELEEMILRASEILKVKIAQEGAKEIAQRSRGTGRVAIRLLKRVRDYVEVEDLDEIDSKLADKVLSMLDIDQEGLDDLDRRILNVIIGQFGGGPVGLSSISAALSEEVDTIADVCEPFLLQQGFIERTKRGRKVTEKGYKHLGMAMKKSRREGEAPQKSLI